MVLLQGEPALRNTPARPPAVPPDRMRQLTSDVGRQRRGSGTARGPSGQIARFAVAAGDAGYDEARTVFNALIDHRPALIARCSGAADIIAAVEFAREHDLLVSIKGGGHGVAGKAVCDGGLMIDPSRMKSIRVDPGAQIVRAEPGVLGAELDRETQAFGR